MGEAFGMMLGAADALRNTNDAWARSLQDAQNFINEQYAEIQVLKNNQRILEERERKLNVALALEKSVSAGLTAKMRAFQAGLKQAYADHPVLRRTGRKYPDGTVEIQGDVIYDKAFDARAAEQRLTGRLRDHAV